MPDSFAPITYEWSPDYTVGVRQIDGEHQQLFLLAQKMQEAMLTGEGKALLTDLLARLVEYTGFHFAHEEQLMERIHYPEFRKHRQQHEDLRAKVRAMQDRAASGEITMTIEVMQFFIAWLKRHTITSDRQIGAFMESHGLPPA
jgi:hemerythrin